MQKREGKKIKLPVLHNRLSYIIRAAFFLANRDFFEEFFLLFYLSKTLTNLFYNFNYLLMKLAIILIYL